jgi:uncharacterized protein YjbI with pentapeptide repeats
LVGDDFVASIVQHLQGSDAVAALVSQHSTQSLWCQAELYHAHALAIPIIPVHTGTGPFVQAAPLELMLRSINYVVSKDAPDNAEVSRRIENRLKTVRHRRLVRNALLLVLGVAAVALLVSYGTQQINQLAEVRQRQALLDRIKGTATVLTGDVIKNYARQFSEDEELVARLLLMRANPELPDTERLNAQLLANALLEPRMLERRWYLEDVNWQQSGLRSAELHNITFMKGILRDMTFDRVAFSGVNWNRAPASGSAGLTLSGLRFNRCLFNGGQFDGTSGVVLDFVNCSFRGVALDVSAFAAVRFQSQVSNPNSSVIIDEITVFENCTLRHCVAPAAPGVIEIIPSDSEVQFKGVFLSNCRFEGLIRAAWFEECTLMNCVLPAAVGQAELAAGGNTVRGRLAGPAGCE